MAESMTGQWNILWLNQSIRDDTRSSKIHRSVLQLVSDLPLRQWFERLSLRHKLEQRLLQLRQDLPDGEAEESSRRAELDTLVEALNQAGSNRTELADLDRLDVLQREVQSLCDAGSLAESVAAPLMSDLSNHGLTGANRRQWLKHALSGLDPGKAKEQIKTRFPFWALNWEMSVFDLCSALIIDPSYQLLQTILDGYSQLADGGESRLDPLAAAILEELLARQCVPREQKEAFAAAIDGLKTGTQKRALVARVGALVPSAEGRNLQNCRCALYACAIQDPAIARAMLRSAQDLQASHRLEERVKTIPIELPESRTIQDLIRPGPNWHEQQPNYQHPDPIVQLARNLDQNFRNDFASFILKTFVGLIENSSEPA